MTVAFVRSHGAESVKTAGTTDGYLVSSEVARGNLLVIRLNISSQYNPADIRVVEGCCALLDPLPP